MRASKIHHSCVVMTCLLSIIATASLTQCVTTRTIISDKSIIETSGVPQWYIVDRYNTNLFLRENTESSGRIKNILSDGTVIDSTEDNREVFTTNHNRNGIRYDVTITPATPRFWKLLQSYDSNGNILQRGKILGGTPVGEWEYYDEQGNKIIVNEDTVHDAGFSYHDVCRFAHRKGLINLETGDGREHFELRLREEGWYIRRFYHDIGEHLFEYYVIDKNTGKVIEHDKVLVVS